MMSFHEKDKSLLWQARHQKQEMRNVRQKESESVIFKQFLTCRRSSAELETWKKLWEGKDICSKKERNVIVSKTVEWSTVSKEIDTVSSWVACPNIRRQKMFLLWPSKPIHVMKYVLMALGSLLSSFSHLKQRLVLILLLLSASVCHLSRWLIFACHDDEKTK